MPNAGAGALMRIEHRRLDSLPRHGYAGRLALAASLPARRGHSGARRRGSAHDRRRGALQAARRVHEIDPARAQAYKEKRPRQQNPAGPLKMRMGWAPSRSCRREINDGAHSTSGPAGKHYILCIFIASFAGLVDARRRGSCPAPGSDFAGVRRKEAKAAKRTGDGLAPDRHVARRKVAQCSRVSLCSELSKST